MSGTLGKQKSKASPEGAKGKKIEGNYVIHTAMDLQAHAQSSDDDIQAFNDLTPSSPTLASQFNIPDIDLLPEAFSLDTLTSRAPSPASDMAISVTGSDFNSEMDVDEIFDDSSLHDLFLEADDRDQFSDMPPLLQDFSDDEGEEGDPLHEDGHVKSRLLLDLLDDTFLSSMDEESSAPSIVPVASVPDVLQHENTPVDDVQPAERPSQPACEVHDDASPYWFWKIILLLVPWLHLHYHLPHRANNLILKVLAIIFHGLGAFGVQDKPEQTLKTVYARLELTDHFDVHPLTIIKGCGVETRIFQAETKVTDGMEKEMDVWRKQENPAGKRTRIQDGDIWQTLRGSDGEFFFDNSSERSSCDELRIGITLGFDGYSYERSTTSSSHSSGVMSSCIANLPTYLHITPGPKEFNSDQLQHFMKNYIDDLLKLYDDGILIKTPGYPSGRRIRVILVAVCCDHPTMCKVCGFGGHSKEEGFCTQCHIPKSKLSTEDAMDYDKFTARDGQEHKQCAKEYHDLPSNPMHSFLLGIIRTQWFNAWINGKNFHQRTRTAEVVRELDQIHAYLLVFEMPSWVARLPEKLINLLATTNTEDNSKSGLLLHTIRLMLATDGDTQGTVASLAREAEESSTDATSARSALPEHISQASVVSVLTCATAENPNPNYLLA
ncbi:hypothetical protein DFJ58DRAFT_842116 [Suillus subalutaceus]|uniref:uncharacterized protein n=1 Tax=Suillus subalutaceus TaxID=48586 RepID=UPI001B87BB34|nr:uncharacterized protein DFJ58DRAFT_842116 [Suillus subalutaceus]KAG1851633.1 hypothetical protein DFJ58DRAFT_842116 [Suillus subalutaceus]